MGLVLRPDGHGIDQQGRMVQKLAFADAHWMNQSGQFTPQVPMDKAQQVVVALHRRPLPLLLEWHSGPMPFGDAPAHHAQRVGNMIGAGGGGVGNVVLAIRVRQGLRWCRRRRFGRRSIAILRLAAYPFWSGIPRCGAWV
ncbi:MAG: hypothetical protein O2985_17490 [Proteobacteria bacterium]|nr:hypothetical protein [Pseudomonadota bacterium]